jgi:hypothetical protein
MCALAPFGVFLRQTRLDAEVDKVEATATCHFLCNYAAVAISMVALEAQETSHLARSRLNPSGQVRLSDLAAKMGSENPPKILVTTLASGDAARLGITKPLEVQVLDITHRKRTCETILREAWFSRDWHVAHVNQKINPGGLQRGQEIRDGTPLVPNRVQRL